MEVRYMATALPADEWLTEDGLLRLSAWMRDGLTYEDIAHNMGISNTTRKVWRKKYPAIASALTRSREVADIIIENALYKRARGYDYTEEIWERKVDKVTGEESMVLVKRMEKHMPPDTTAQIFWLKNRKTDVWRDKREVSADVTDGRETGVAIIAPVIEEAVDGKLESST
jgi:hypothetical protein